jgi:acyl-coenzyme A synthetase/AMP-(fatty) acid ligase
MSWFGTWNCGASLFVHQDSRPFSATVVLDNLHHFPIATLCTAPTAYRQLLTPEHQDYLKRKPPQCLTHCTGVGEPLNPSVIEIWEKMTGIVVCDGYGQTETSLVCANWKGTPVKPGSMGKPHPEVPLYVIDKDGKECPPGVDGDIAILRSTGSGSFGMFDGYLNVDGTVDSKTKILGGKPWYLTGDRASRDEDGYFWFIGRADDVINSSGYRIGNPSHPSILIPTKSLTYCRTIRS